MGIQQNGKIVVAGTAFTTTFVGSVFRYNIDGSPDTSFGNGGKTLTPIGTGFNEFYGMKIQPDGKIVAAGYSSNGSEDDFTIARYQGDATTPTQRTVFDFDGDGKTDISIFRPTVGEWWIKKSSNSSVVAFQFGSSSDKPVQGDYTGDGKADVAIWRPTTGEWFILRSENQSYYSFPFGTTRDFPAPGDYDGDGKFDATVFRPPDSTWHVQRSTAGTLIQSFGQSGDMPVPSAFVP